MQISEAFRDAGFWFRVGDYQFHFTCSCGVEQQLDVCTRSEHGDVTVYACPHCGEQVAGVTQDDAPAARVTSPERPSDENGHHMCGYVFGTTVDMDLWPPAALEAYLHIPRRPAFFTTRNLARSDPPQAS